MAEAEVKSKEVHVRQNPSLTPDESSIEEVQMMVDYLKYDNEIYETELSEKKKKMKTLMEKDTKLRQEQFLLEKQIELFNQEVLILHENFKDCNWKINKEFCVNILKIEKAPTIFLNMVEIFLYTLDQQNTSFSYFKEILQNFSNFKNLMMNVKENEINEDKICRLMELWKSNDNLEAKLQNKVPGSELLLKWLNLILEMKLKKNTIKNIEEKLINVTILLIEILDEKNELNKQIKELNSHILNMKLNLKKIRFSLNNIKTMRSNKLYNNSYDSPTKENERKKCELDICIEPKSKVIVSRKEGNKVPLEKVESKLKKNQFEIGKETGIFGSFNEANYDNSNKSVLVRNNKPTNSDSTQDDIFLNAFKQIKINVTPIENASKPLPKSDIRKGRNSDNRIMMGNNVSLGFSFSRNDNVMYRTENRDDKKEIENGLIDRPVRNPIIIESHQTSSKYNCSKQISNFFC